MSSPPARGLLVPVRSTNENKALRQAAQATAFSAAAGPLHSPTKMPIEPKPQIVVPRPSGCINPAKPKVLPGLAPLNPIGAADDCASGRENCQQPSTTTPELKPRSNLREKMAALAAEVRPKHHSADGIAPLPYAQPSPGEPSDDAEAVPAPILTWGKRRPRKPAGIAPL
jgi:hypothetical protein